MRIVRYYVLAVFLTIGVLLSAACQSEPQAQVTPAAPAVGTTGSAPTGTTAGEPRPIPSPSPDKAVVHGVVRQIDTKKPLGEAEGVDVFLAQLLHSGDNSMTMSSLDKTT